jgi:hypothetical protein
VSYARINTVEYNSEADADAAAADYAEKAPGEFTEAQVLLSVRTGPTTGMAVSLYPDKAAFERSAPVREARLARMQRPGQERADAGGRSHPGTRPLAFTGDIWPAAYHPDNRKLYSE